MPPRRCRGVQGSLGLAAVAVADADRDLDLDDDASDLDDLRSIPWTLPTADLLDLRQPARPGTAIDHTVNIRRIEEKLRHFGIEAKVVATNTGPVVTQYEVRPDKSVKVSRIEALADDLAMALAARSIRIEAPIPGKDVVGIEIPNQNSEVVGFRPFLDEKRMQEAPSPLMFALGRDVSGEAMVVDLAKMPHLLIAGATGSGKSVCVNALITSFLMRARPDEVRLILVDLKRVELAPYNGLPHLLQHVIVEPNEAKAVINWAVHEMEDRYKILAAKTVRNVEAYNALPGGASRREAAVHRAHHRRARRPDHARGPQGRGPDRQDRPEGAGRGHPPRPRHAAAVGQRRDRPHQGQRPVADRVRDVVDGRLADGPRRARRGGPHRSRRHALPAGRPAPSGPGPGRLRERQRGHRRDPALARPGRRAHVLPADVFEFGEGDGGNGGQFAWLREFDVDEMTPVAAELVVSEGRASTSRLQTKLKLGFARASRVMSELEDRGIIGPQDPRNPASPRAIYGPDNWLRSTDDVDRTTEGTRPAVPWHGE